MRNLQWKTRFSSWRNSASAVFRDAAGRASRLRAQRGALSVWLIGGLMVILLVSGAALVKLTGKRNANSQNPATSAAATVTTAKTAPLQVPQAAKKPSPLKVTIARRPKLSVTLTKSSQANAIAGSTSTPVAAPPALKQILLSPPVSTVPPGQAEKEGADIARARASWFFDQRAYPNQHIPEGALQKAIEERDAMKARQRLAATPQLGPNGIISFPGDALWHLMGPQPVNEPFSVNSGFPTASGRVTAIAVDPTDATGNTVYIGAAAGGVWKTTNGGTSWTPLTDSQPSLAVGSIAIDPNNHLTIYVGTGEENFNGDAFYGTGILKSTDGGTTWTQTGGPFGGALTSTFGGAKIGAIAVQPGNSSIVLAAAYFFDGNDAKGGIYRSTDGGATWALPTTGAQGSAATDVVFDPAGSATTTATVYAALGDIFSGATANGIWKSTDSGANWTKMAGGLPASNVGRIKLGYAPSTTGATATIYAAIADSSVSSSNLLGLFVTTNAGAASPTWTALAGPAAAGGFCAGQCFYDMVVAVHPTNPNFVVLGGGAFNNNSSTIFRSTNGGTTWTDVTAGSTNVRPHVDTHAFGFNASGSRFFVGNDGGMWLSDNLGTTPPLWVDLNATLAITQFYPGPSAGISDENYGFGGTQDNDTDVFTGTLDWTNTFTCGDGGFTAIDPGTPTTVYTTCDKLAGAIVNKSVFNGAVINGPNPNFGAPFAGPNPTFNAADTGINHADRMQFIPPLAIDDGNPNTLYFGTFQVYQTNDGANTWNVMDIASPDLTAGGGTITNLEVGHHASNLVVAGTSNGKVWETVNATAGAGATWTEIDRAPLPGRHVTAVRIPRDDTSGNTVYVTFSGFGSCAGCGATPGHVFVTTNGTAATPTWTDISGDLPDIPVNDIIVDHNNNPPFDALYIGTDVGVFSCPSPLLTLCANWTVVGDGLPNSPVLGLAQRRSSRILRAATHGRSMWQIQLTDENPQPVAFLSSLTPAAAFVGDPTTQVTVTGGNFSANTLVLFDGVSVGTPTFVSTTQLTISVNSSLLTNGHVFQVSLSDPQGADTGSGPFAVMNPVLNATSMTPSSTTTYTPVTLQFSGGAAPNFVSGTVVTFNGVTLTGGTVTGGGTGFSVPVPVSLLTLAMPVTVTITNPLPGGGPTPAKSFAFTINPNPNPLAIFSPNPIVLGPVALGGSTLLTTLQLSNPGGATLNVTAESITGTNLSDFGFVAPTLLPGQVSCNFQTTGVVSLTSGSSCIFGMSFTADVPTGNVNPRTATLNVTDNGVGNPQAVSVLGLLNVPTVAISPVNFGPVGIGTTSPTMNATLINFSGATLNVNSTGFTVSGTNAADFQFVPAAPSGNPPCGSAPFSIPANTLCDVGLVFTPSIAGNESATISVSDNGPGSPQSAPLSGVGIELTSILPPIVATGGPAFTLTVNGGGFAPSAVVNVNGSARLTTFISSNELLASIPASDIATAGTLAITVTSPNPGGTTSEPKTLFIAQAPPANNDNINFALFHRAGATTFRTASGPFTGGGAAVTLTWSSPFANTSYTAICTTEVIPGIFSLPTITLRTTTTITVVPAPGGTPSGIIACMAIPDTDASTVRKARVPITSATNVTVTWSPAFSSNAYAVVCSVESTSAGVFTSVISTFSPASIVVDNSTYASGTMHCIGIPKDGTYPSNIRAPKTPISGSPQGVAVTFGVPFNGFTNDNTDYVAACSDVEPGVVSSTASLAILAGSKTVNGFTVINGIPSGTLDCIAVPLGGSANSRFTEDTTQTTAQLAAITSPASLATPIDPIPSCAPGTATLQGRARSVWQVYTAPESGTAVADTRFSSYPTILSAWTISAPLPSSSETFTQLACASGNVPAAGSSPVQSEIIFNVTKGTTYYLMVSDASSAAAGGILTFNIDAGDVAPANDDNAAPITVTPAQLPYSNTVNSVLATANTNSHTDPTPPCAPGGAANGGQANSVWYSFTPSSNGTITADTLTSPYATILNVTSGSANGTQVACNQSAAAGIAQSQVSFAAVSGTPYFFMISSVLGDGGTTNFHLNFTAGGVGAPAKLAFTTQPSNAAAGASISPAVQVAIQDASGNTVTTATNSVTIAIGTNPSGGTLGGTATVAAVNGIATFANLSINKTGTGYTLTASATGLTGATSSAFNVTPGAATKLAYTVQPSNVAAGASISPAVQVTVEDAQGNTVTSATNSITIAIGTNPSGGTLSGTTTVAAVNGIATFSNLSIDKTGTGYTLAASATGLTGATSSAFNVTPGAATKLAFTVQPTNVGAGSSITPAVQVTIQDALGNTVTSATNSITMGIGTNPGGGTLSGTTTVAAVSGVATFSNLSINNAGVGYTLTATATGLTGATSSAFNVTSGTAAKLAFTAQPTNVGAGSSITPSVQVTVQDSSGNTVTTATNSITIAIGTNPSGGTLSGTTTVAAVNGIATFSNLSIDKTGTGYTLTASATGLTGATSSAFNVTPGAATKLAYTVQPSNVAAGASISPAVQVTVEDAQGNTVTSATNSITIAIGTNPSGGTLSGTTTVAAVSGVASFSNLSINKTGTGYTLAASATGLTGATSSAFNVTPGAATKLAFTVQPTNVGAGSSITPAVQVTIQDALGNTVTSATNSITMGIGTNPGGGTLSGTTTVAAVSGVATFSNLSINNAGVGYTLTANATGLTSATSSAFNVTSGTAAKAVFTVQPSGVGAGSIISPPVQVSIEDALGNVVTTATNSVTIAIGTNPSGGTLSGTSTASAVAGVATFSNLSINLAGNGYTLTASSTGLTGATSNAFNVTSGTPAKLAFTVQPTNTAAGASITPPVQVAIQDAQGNTVTSATNMVTVAIGTNPAGGTLSGTTTVAAVNGIASFSGLNINNVGTGYTLTASATGLTGATSSAFNVTAGAPAKLVFNVQPTNVVSGSAITPALQVGIQDANGNPVSTATNAVTIAIGTNPGSGTLSGTLTVNAVAGVATFSNLSIDKAGNGYTLAGSATGLTGASSTAFNVTAGVAAKLAFTAQPSNVTSTVSITPAVQVSVQDANGNPVTTATNAVTIAIGTNPAGGTLSGTLTVNAVAGVATFSNLSIDKAGTAYTLAASATGLAGATSAAFNVTAGVAAKLAFTVQPSNVAAGASITPAVQVGIQDSQGNLTGATNAVTIAIGTNPASGTLSGTLTVNSVAGVATFSNLSINNLGTGYTLAASATGLTGATSSAFNVTAGAPAKVVFTVQPSNVVAGSAIAPAVQATIEDAQGNVVGTATNAVTVAIGTNPSSGTLSGTLTLNAVAGVATFSTLSINKAGTGYTLAASATGLTGATSSAFNVSAGPPAKVTATSGTPQAAVIGAAFAAPLTATVTDANSNTVSGVLVTFTPPTSGASGTFAGGVNTATTNTSGVATSGVFTANSTAGGPYNVVASATGATSANFALTNNNPVPAITSFSPANANAGGAAFVLTINGANFVSGATGTFSGAARTVTFVSATQVTMAVTAGDIATGGNFPVVITNPGPGGGPSPPSNFTVNNPAPTLTSAKAGANTHAPGGAGFTLTVTGTLFVSTSVINFNGKAEPTTFVSATQLTAAIPANDVATAGTFPVTVTNPAPGGGTTAAVNFTIDGYTVSGPANTPVKAGQQATITITVTPSANGFINAVSFSVSGLPAHSTATFNPTSATPNGAAATTTLTIMTTARGEVPPAAPVNPPTAPLLRLMPLLWLAALLIGLFAMQSIRRTPQLRRYAALVPLALLLVTGAVLAGCVGGKQGTPAGPAQLTISATSGTMSQTTNVTLTVN